MYHLMILADSIQNTMNKNPSSYRGVFCMNWCCLFCNVLVFILLFSRTQAQSLDSLENLLESSAGPQKVHLLNELTYQYSFKDAPMAIRFGEQALDLALHIGDDRLLAQTYNDLSIAYIGKGDYEQSLVLNEKALKIRELLGDSMQVAASLSKLGNVHFELGRFDKALRYYLRALAIYEGNNASLYAGQIYNNIGTIYEKNGELERSIEYREKSIEIAQQYNDLNVVITAKGNVANVLQKMGRYKEAESLFLSLIPLIDSTGNKEHLSSVYQGLGVNARMQGKTQDGAMYYRKALKVYEDMGNETGISLINVNLGNVYTDLKQFQRAEEHLNKGLKISLDNNSYTQIIHAYMGLSDLEKERGEFDKAWNYLKLASLYKDSTYSENITEQIAEMGVKYETEKKERELAEKESELAKEQLRVKQRNYWLGISIGLFFIFAVIGVLLFRQQKMKRRQVEQETLMKVQNERLRISRDLHDHIGAELTLISSALDAESYREEDTKKKANLESISDNARNAMTQLRETIWAIRSQHLTLKDFMIKIREYANKIETVNDGAMHIVIGEPENGSLVLSPAQTIGLYRICQEALNNAMKYANASEIKVQAHCSGTSFSISITDNGKGFDKDNIEFGYGLRNMEERAHELGWTFTLETAPNAGTRIEVSRG